MLAEVVVVFQVLLSTARHFDSVQEFVTHISSCRVFVVTTSPTCTFPGDVHKV